MNFWKSVYYILICIIIIYSLRFPFFSICFRHLAKNMTKFQAAFGGQTFALKIWFKQKTWLKNCTGIIIYPSVFRNSWNSGKSVYIPICIYTHEPLYFFKKLVWKKLYKNSPLFFLKKKLKIWGTFSLLFSLRKKAPQANR